jgi:hypothetical protein
MTTPRRFAPGAARENPRSRYEGLALAVARTLMVCGLRKPWTIGFEMLAVGALLKTAFCLLASSSIVNFPLVTWIIGNQIARGDDWSLRLFALGFLAAGFILRQHRKSEKWDPERPHRLDCGISWFTFLPIRQDYVYRFVDPGVAFLAGALLRARLGCPLLGLWCMLAALSLAVVEWGLHQQTEQHDWQLGDGPREAARDAEAMKAMTGRDAGISQQAAIPTGMDESLAADIARRQRERGGEAARDLA